MKRLFLLLLLVLVALPIGTCFAANSQTTNEYYEYATVDTAPGADGYATNAIAIRGKQVTRAWFSVGGTGTMTVTLQFKRAVDSDWNDYATYTGTERRLIEGGGAGVLWRAVVKNGDYTSGTKIFGFDW